MIRRVAIVRAKEGGWLIQVGGAGDLGMPLLAVDHWVAEFFQLRRPIHGREEIVEVIAADAGIAVARVGVLRVAARALRLVAEVVGARGDLDRRKICRLA